MFKLFKKANKRVEIIGKNVFIDNSVKNIGESAEVENIFQLSEKMPEINVYEDGRLIRNYKIHPIINQNLEGQYLHSSIRVLSSSAVMIDGVISSSSSNCPIFGDTNYEGVRFQPFFLSNENDKNICLIGKGLFERGLHFSGRVTPASIRCVCICDECSESFNIQHFHAGFSEVQYFYSTNSRETLIVPLRYLKQIGKNVQTDYELKEIEKGLPNSADGAFKYYNSFRCPHRLAPFIDFERFKEMRLMEYYGNTLINAKVKAWEH